MEVQYVEQLTAHDMVCLERLTVPQLVMKISDLYLVGANE
jgi:hypothetical protein